MTDPFHDFPDLLLRRFEQVYPNGVFEEPDDNAVSSEAEIAALADVLRPVRTEACLHALLLRMPLHEVDVLYSLEETVSPAEWISWTQEAKEAWIADNDGTGMTLWCLRMSRVAPVYITYFNCWRLSPETGKLGIGLPSEPPDQRWKDATTMLHHALRQQGWVAMTPELARVQHPTITAFDWDDPEFEGKAMEGETAPPRKPALTAQLLFGDD